MFFSSFCAAYIFFITLLKGLDDTQSCLGYVLSTKLSFHILCFLLSTMCTLRHRKDYDEQKAVVVVQASLPGLPLNMKHANMQAKFSSWSKRLFNKT